MKLFQDSKAGDSTTITELRQFLSGVTSEEKFGEANSVRAEVEAAIRFLAAKIDAMKGGV
jgi:hypothetical protein